MEFPSNTNTLPLLLFHRALYCHQSYTSIPLLPFFYINHNVEEVRSNQDSYIAKVQWHQLTLVIGIQRPSSNSSSLSTGTANSSSTRLPTHKKQPRSSSWSSIRKRCGGWEDTSSHWCCRRRYAERPGKPLRFDGSAWTTKGVIFN